MLNTASLRSSLPGYLQVFANRREVSTDTLNHHNEMVRKVGAVVEQVATKEDGIKASKVLSDEGKSQALAELSTASAPKFGFLERVTQQLDEDLRATKATLFTVKAPVAAGSDPLLRYLYGKEIRDRYQGLNQQERDTAFLEAAEGPVTDPDRQAQANRDEILWAFQVTPGGPMLSLTQAVMRRALEDRAKRLNPETVARLHQVELLHESLSGLRDSVALWLQGLGGDPQTIYSELGGDEPATPPIDVARRMVHA